MNPLAGVAQTMGAIGKAMRAKPVAPAPRVQPNRAQRRAREKGSATGQALAAARRAGWDHGHRGLDHRTAGACPYIDRARIDAWSAGYVDGKRKREETRP